MKHAVRVLVVDDDQTSRHFLQFALAKRGFEVASAEDATDAQRQLSPSQIREFDCVVTDYRMPDINGLELMAWIQERDPTLATIIMTAESEKRLIAESLRNGATDFLDKPIALERLNATIERAVERTRRQRQLTQSESAVRQVGLAQARMLGAEAAPGPVGVEVCFHPQHEAGGDYFSRFQLTPTRFFCLLTDVSGHDLQAAYISAYFQGVVRGMLERAASVEDVFATFNRLLLDDWCRSGAESEVAAGVGVSVAACAILIDSAAQTATVSAHGMPAPVYWPPQGEAHIIGETGGFPLGWFPDFSAQAVVQSISAGGSFCLWTDGLEEVAQKCGVSELSLAWALQKAKARSQRLPEIDSAADDILVADIHLPSVNSSAKTFRPLLLQSYHGGQSGEIDEIQRFWQRSLLLAIPDLPETKLHDVLLASREVLLNALKHGCGGHLDQKATFQVAFCAPLNVLRIRVSDPGPGHNFEFTAHDTAGEDLAEAHRGLILINHLASRLSTARNGASLTLDFDLNITDAAPASSSKTTVWAPVHNSIPT